MKYHFTLAQNDVFGELAGSHFPCSLDDFNEPSTALIVKKRTATLSLCTLLISLVLYLGSNGSTSFKIYSFRREFKIKRILGDLASTFYLFVKKRFLCAILPIFDI